MTSIADNSFNPEVLAQLRNQLAYSESEVARFLDISTNEYVALENGAIGPSKEMMGRISKLFRVEPYVLYKRIAPRSKKRIDFRTSLQSYRGEPGPILDAIKFSEGIKSLLNTVTDYRYSWTRHSNRTITLDSNPEVEAIFWRDYTEVLDDAQLTARSSTAFFTYLRSKIELLGISVVVSSFEEKFLKGMTLGTSETVPIILINSYKQQKSSRTFTLAHEFGHVLLRNDDVSNPYKPEGNIEKFCNKFAAAFLMPKALVARLLGGRSGQAYSDNNIRWLANKLKVSMEAIVIRLQDCGFAPEGFWRRWKNQFGDSLPSEEEERGGGSSETGPDQGVIKLASFGFLFGLLVPARYRTSGLTSSAVYRASRLKPEYFSALELAAKERLAEVQAYGSR